MNDNRISITLNGREIILIGTAHISRESIEEVDRSIREEQPDLVCVELDGGRHKSITEQSSWEQLDVSKVFKEGKGFLLIANLVLFSFQRRMGQELGVKPGEEMRTALDTATELGIPYALCDREVQLTLRRAWAACKLWSKCKLLASLLTSAFTTDKFDKADIENLKKRNELEGMMDDLAIYLPEVKTTLIDERDRYLAAKLWTSGAGVRKQLAVIGAGHITGIKAHLERIARGEETADIADLDTIPPPKLWVRALTWILPALLVAFFIVGFFFAGADVSLAMLIRWVLWNGSLAALGALLALGHPLSILVSFVGAPFGTISPFVSIGLFSGVAEATLRKPRVSDAQNLSSDITSLKGLYRNRITRALLVFFLSSLGGAIGNIISVQALASLLVK
ncbi:MAG: TraB/GumN family protein [Treponema sp.]|jgi:pheromone shutdown-related protein TraB|nr:TraB/GumN family protein [Treponema sp.]